MRLFSRAFLRPRLKRSSHTTSLAVAFYFRASASLRWHLPPVRAILVSQQSLTYGRARFPGPQTDLVNGACCGARNVVPRLKLRAEESSQRRAQDNLRQTLSGLLLIERLVARKQSVLACLARITYLHHSLALPPA